MHNLAMPCPPRFPALRGFTLIELMITVAIVAILAAVAVPQYKNYVTSGRVPDATSGLATKAVLSEQFFLDNRTYADVGALKNPGCASDTTSSKTFSFSCGSTASASGYTLTATGKGTMLGFTYTLDQAGKQATTAAPTGWTTSTTCWVRKKDGSC